MTDTTDDNPYAWRNGTALWAELPIDRDVAAALLPPGYRPTDPATAIVFVADYPVTNFGAQYHEGALLVRGTDDRGPFVHCPWMVVDNDVALFMGRELMGFPKVLGEISLKVTDGACSARVVRNGHELLRLDGVVATPDHAPPSFVNQRFVNVVGSTLTGMSILEFGPGGEQIHWARTGTGRVTIGSGDPVLDPLAVQFDATLHTTHYDCSDTVNGVGVSVGAPIDDPEWTFTRYFSALS